jgi:hypothetical protein
VTISRGLRSPSSRATASVQVASPQSTRCRPSSHRSPGRDTADSGSGGAAFAFSSSSSARRLSISPGSNPVNERSKSDSWISCNSTASNYSSQSAHVTERLTISRNALTCAGDHSLQRITGTSVIPSFRAALRRRCPSTTSQSLRTRHGILNPNSRTDAHMRSTAVSFLGGFRGYSTSRSSRHISMRVAAGYGWSVCSIASRFAVNRPVLGAARQLIHESGRRQHGKRASCCYSIL